MSAMNGIEQSACAPQSVQKIPWWVWVLALLFIVAAVERVYGIDRQSLWSDELYAVMASYKPFSGAWQMMLADSHPPGYLSFMYVILPLTGYSDFGVRLHALLFGLLWIPFVFWVCRRWFSVYAALAATAVIASAYNAVYYSQEARAYSMLIVFNLWNVGCLLEILFNEQHDRRHRWGFVVSAIAMLYLHYSGFIFLCAEMLLCAIFWLLSVYKGGLKTLIFLFGVPLLVFSPWFGVMYSNLTTKDAAWVISPVPTLQETYYTIQRLLAPDDAHMQFHCLAMMAVIGAVVWLQIRRGLSQTLLVVYSLFFLMVIPVLAFYVESWIGTPIFEKRYFLMSMVIEAMLVGWVIVELCSWLSAKWLEFSAIAFVAFFTVWTINANAAFGLYTALDKDPIREATNIIKTDINKTPNNSDYAVIMTHPWFEHYLKRNGINFDKNWVARRYFVSQQFPEILKYFDAHKDKKTLYYIALRESNAQAALVPLMLNYQLVSKASAAIEVGTIDVFKFDLQSMPDDAQLKAAGSNPSNDIARLVAHDIGQKDPSTYRILYTHNWVLPYLKRNGVVTPEGQEGSYVVNAQADSVYRYIGSHPNIDTLYYLAVQEPNAEGAELMLQLHYHLISETTLTTAVGKMSILKYNVKEAPVVNETALQRVRAGQTNQVAEWLLKDINQAVADSFVVAIADEWVEPYIKLNHIPVDEAWSGRRYLAAADAPKVESYISQHTGISTLYYIAFRQPTTEQAAAALQQRYHLADKTSVDVAVGVIDIYKFNTK